MENNYNIVGKLEKRIKRTPDVESFRFIPDRKISFIPGQFLKVIFDKDNPANKDLNKYLSISSAPGKDYIEVTKKLTNSDFSRKLKNLETGREVYFQGPLGQCILEAKDKRITFLIGGIGITPVISILGYIVENNLDTDAILLYSNRDEEIAFKEELDKWQTLDNIKVYYILTDCLPKDNRCIAGHIDKELLKGKVEDWPERTFFLFGPSGMVKAMKKICFDLGCVKDKVKTEVFLGY